MRDEIARGLLFKWLNLEQREDYQEAEKQLPTEKWWRTPEILSHLRIHATGYIADQAEVSEMERCWNDFYKRVLGPLTLTEDGYHPAGCTTSTCKHAPDARIKSEAERMQAWDGFVHRNYRPPQVGSSIEASLKLA